MLTKSAAPTTVLPPLRKLQGSDTGCIFGALSELRTIYAPLPRVSGFNHTPHTPHEPVDSGYASADEDEDEDCMDIDHLRADPMEREFTIKWLTGLIARADSWCSAGDNEDSQEDQWQYLIDEASELLASFSDPPVSEDSTADIPGADPGAVTRDFTFAVSEPGQPDVHLVLIDAPLLDTDHTAVGLQSWGASIVLGDMICASPAVFGLVKRPDGQTLRVLELGAGTGVLSMVASRLLGEDSEVVATDFHPAVLDNLRLNVASNAPQVIVSKLDWTVPDQLEAAPSDGNLFDVVLAADVVYDPEHATLLKNCAARWLKPGGTFWLAATIRPNGRFAGVVDTIFSVFPMADASAETEGKVLAAQSVEDISKRRGIGRSDEVGYKLVRIAWT